MGSFLVVKTYESQDTRKVVKTYECRAQNAHAIKWCKKGCQNIWKSGHKKSCQNIWKSGPKWTCDQMMQERSPMAGLQNEKPRYFFKFSLFCLLDSPMRLHIAVACAISGRIFDCVACSTIFDFPLVPHKFSPWSTQDRPKFPSNFWYYFPVSRAPVLGPKTAVRIFVRIFWRIFFGTN